jgi:ATP-dependent 26S proteasome regulatory subunit
VERSRLSGAAVNNIVTEITLLKLLTNEYIVQMKDFQWNERFVLHTELQIKYSSPSVRSRTQATELRKRMEVQAETGRFPMI